MKNFFKYIGIFSLMCFSFYYTKEVAEFFKKDDVVMKEIENYASIHDKECTEGYINDEGVVLSISGLVVDKDLSYSSMKGTGFDSSLIKYKEIPCIVSLENNKDNYIIGGNPSKNGISLIINVINGKSINDIILISKNKSVELNFLIDYKYLENNKEIINNILNNNYDILYKGNNEKDLKTFIKDLKSINKNKNTFCVYTDNEDVLNYCMDNNLNTIKTNKIYNKNYLSNIKTNLSKGDIIILDESINLKNELGVIINYVKSRGLKIITVNEHLK